MRFVGIILALFWGQLLFGQELKGKVVSVVDGDTYKVLINNKTVKVRLLGIDCPEHDQSYGYRATQMSIALVQNKNIIIRIKGKDLYHRVLGTVFLENGTNVCKELVKTGYAWKYKYSNDHDLENLEKEAKKAKLGIWADPSPVSPWDFKKSQKKKKKF